MIKVITTLSKKELKDMFSAPIAYVFIVAFLFLVFWLFFTNVFVVGEASLRPFFAWMPLLFTIFLPSLTMGKWSEEKRLGTQELLFTLPAHESSLVIGKLFSCLAFLFIVLLLTLPLPILMSTLGDLDIGIVITSYLGAFLLGACYITIGLWISSLTQSQIVSFIITVLLLFFLFIIGEPVITSYLPKKIVPVFQFLSYSKHFESFARGVIDSRSLVYFLSSGVLFVSLNIFALNSRKHGFDIKGAKT